MHVIPLEDESDTRIVLYLVKNLKNAKGLRKKILSGELNCCAVKASLVVDPVQVVVAAKKAVLSRDAGKLTTRSLNSELLYNLSVSKNISQSLTKFGIGDNDENVLIVVFQGKGESILESVKSEVEGEECDISELEKLSDTDLVQKTYKITDIELQVSTLPDSVVSRIATKEFGST